MAVKEISLYEAYTLMFRYYRSRTSENARRDRTQGSLSFTQGQKDRLREKWQGIQGI